MASQCGQDVWPAARRPLLSRRHLMTSFTGRLHTWRPGSTGMRSVASAAAPVSQARSLCVHRRVLRQAAGLTAALCLSAFALQSGAAVATTADNPLDDQSGILRAGKRDVSQKLQALESIACGGVLASLLATPWFDCRHSASPQTHAASCRDTGYRVRVLTKVAYNKGDLDAARAAWGMDRNTVLLVFDPTAPNVFGYDYIGDDVLLGPLRRPFWLELQSRFGNMFYGEAVALQSVVDTVEGCLRNGGCVRVPGLPDEQYYFTLVLSIIGGIVCGFSFRLEPNEVVSRRWFWPLLFSPLWGSLFVSFGLGPIVSRTDDVQPVLQNVVAFAIAALLFRPRPVFAKESPDQQQ